MKPPERRAEHRPDQRGNGQPGHGAHQFARSIVRTSTRRPTGVIIAPPQPWTMRAATNCGSVLDRPHRIEPSMKTTMAARNTVRAPKRSAAQPEAG